MIDDVYVGGIVGGFRGLKTKKGDPMCVFTLEDHQGAVEVVVFPEMYGKHRMLIENGALLLVRGKFERDEENSRFQCTDILPLALLKERLSRGVRIRLKATCPRETIEALWELLPKHRGDRPVAVEVEMNGGSRHVIVRAEVTAVDPRAHLGTVRRRCRTHLRTRLGHRSLVMTQAPGPKPQALICLTCSNSKNRSASC